MQSKIFLSIECCTNCFTIKQKRFYLVDIEYYQHLFNYLIVNFYLIVNNQRVKYNIGI